MKIVIVALHEYRYEKSNQPKIFSLDNELIQNKIDYLAKRIRDLCKQLKTQSADAMWIISWRERLLCHSRSFFLSAQMKAHFKKTMIQLTLDFPQLCIIGGINSKKEITAQDSPAKLETLAKIYNDHQAIATTEQAISSTSKGMDYHQMQLSNLQKEKPQEITIIRNTIYIFQNGEVLRHDKSVPWDETRDRYDFAIPNGIFQPPKGRNKNNCISLKHPLSHKFFRIGLENCREHYMGTLKNSGEKKPLIHFILSASTDTKAEHIHGTYLIHIDSNHFPKILEGSTSFFSSNNIQLYVNEITNKNTCELIEVTSEKQPEPPKYSREDFLLPKRP